MEPLIQRPLIQRPAIGQDGGPVRGSRPRGFAAGLFVLVCAALLLAPAAWAIDITKLKPSGYVNDFAGVIDGRNKQAIEEFAANLERVAGSQLAVVTVESLDDDPVEDVANKLFIQWGIGKKTGDTRDEGALILLSIKDRKSRIEVGYGLEAVITDATAGGILRSIRPVLRNGDYGGALLAASQQLGQLIAQSKGLDLGVPGVQIATRTGRPQGIPWPLIIIGIIILLSLLNRNSSGGGGGGGFLTGMILGNMMGRGGRGGWGGGGFGGYDGGGGGGGFGGFGGGSSGGGGASSDW
jgi:uncharacterized protein